MRRILILLIGLLMLSCTAAAEEKGELSDGAVYRFSCAGSDFSLAASSFGLSDVATVAQLERYNGSLNQAWRVHAREDGAWELECLVTGQYLTVLRNSKKDGAAISLADYTGKAGQRWYIQKENGGWRLISAHSEKSLQPVEGVIKAYEKVRQFETADEKSQLWEISMLDDGSTVFPRMLLVKGDVNKASCLEIIRADGMYYAVSAVHDGCGYKMSEDMIHWTEMENAFYIADIGPWKRDNVENGDLWCPGIYRIGEKYYIYYALSKPYSVQSSIGLLSNTTLDPADPNYKWVDEGEVIRSDYGSSYNCIDPCVIIDDAGDPWMVFGSGMTGIKITRLNAQTGKLLDEENPQIIGLASRARGDKAIEAGYMIQHDDDYYLFVAAGPMSPGTYFNGVGRGESVTGPFYARDGVAMMDGGKRGGATLITEPKEGIDMPGHCAPFQDDDGQWYFLIEYFPEGYGAKLGISTMVWDEEGWPWTALTADVVGKLGTGPVK